VFPPSLIDFRLIRQVAWLAGLAMIFSSAQPRADDIDIYRRGAGIGQPWVHVLLDVRAAASDKPLCTYGVDCQPPFLSPRAHRLLGEKHAPGEPVTASAIVLAVLAAVLEEPGLGDVRVSLIMSNHPGNAPGGTVEALGGGTILAGYGRLADARERMLTILQSIPLDQVPDDQVLQPREALYEWYRYVNGAEVALGTNTSGNFGEPDPHPDYDPDILSGNRYLSPFTDQGDCPRLFGVLVLLGAPGADDALDEQISRSLSLPAGSGAGPLLSLFHQAETDLLSSLQSPIRIRQTLVLATRAQALLANAYASASGGSEAVLLERPAAAEAALRAFFNGALDPGASFAPTAIAPDVLRPGSLLDRFYVPLFRSSGQGRWIGNVKKYRLRGGGPSGGGSSLARLVDVRGWPAFELQGPGRGSIAFDALSFWTDAAALPPGDGVTLPIDADGRVVDRGGAGQKIDGFIDPGPGGSPVIGDANSGGEAAARQVYTEPTQSGPLVPFNADALTIDLLRGDLDPDGLLSAGELLELVRWGRGQDVDSGTGRARRWLVGGVIHSRPLAINYGATPGYSRDNPDVRLFFGTTDGVFHGLEDTDVAGAESGRERFAFYPRQMLQYLAGSRQTANRSAAGFYGVDGAPVALRVDRDGNGTIEPDRGDEVYVYFGLRRGGRGYYALDVSDPQAPPGLAWVITPGGDFAELGLGFSTPVVGRVRFEAAPRDVLIFAAGYHGGWNVDGTARIGKDLGHADDPLGNAIYVVDARSGELIWKAVRGNTGSASERHYEHAGLKDSIPSQLAALRTPEGIVHRLYVGDTGGAVWRVDLPPGDAPGHRRDNWYISKLADLGADPDEPGGSEARDLRFFHPPEIVRSTDARGAFDGVLIQSGDRAHPLETGARNHLFYIKDRRVVSGAASRAAGISGGSGAVEPVQFEDLPDQTGCVLGTESDAAGVSCRERPLAAGWKLGFPRPGEKGLSTPVVDGGRVLATTFTPSNGTVCAPSEGQGRLYALHLADATALAGGVRVRDLGSGIPPEPIHLGDTILLPGGGVDVGDLDPAGGTGITRLIPTAAPQRYRVYWREPAADPL
jgi:type IV pilus assembly protein PilY1